MMTVLKVSVPVVLLVFLSSAQAAEQPPPLDCTGPTGADGKTVKLDKLPPGIDKAGPMGNLLA